MGAERGVGAGRAWPHFVVYPAGVSETSGLDMADGALADLVVVGGGIVGVATAWQLLRRHPGRRVVVLEKEPQLAEHQTGRNSGVLHSGIYYKPGSLKALNCRRGKEMMERFCREQSIDHEICGKVIVAVGEADLAPLANIFERGRANGVACEMIDADRLRELEPHAAGIRAIHVPEAGIVNYRQVTERLAQLVREAGGAVRTGWAVTGIVHEADSLRVLTTAGEVRARLLVNCAGLHSDRIARLAGDRPAVKIVPFRGEYYELRPEARHLCRNLIYPTPDAAFPFLGVHFTRLIGRDEAGHRVECGPNAVLAFGREGYRKTTLNMRDLAESLAYPAFWRLSARHWRTGLGEWHRSVSKKAFVKALQRLLPAVRAEHLEPAPAGVRAQALAPDGRLVDDFSIVESARCVHVLNAPSPAATASLAIGEHIVDILSRRLEPVPPAVAAAS